MSELTFEFDAVKREPSCNRSNGLLFLCFVGVLVIMVFIKVSASRLQSRVEDIEARLQEIEERLPAQPAPVLMEGGAR